MHACLPADRWMGMCQDAAVCTCLSAACTECRHPAMSFIVHGHAVLICCFGLSLCSDQRIQITF